jgi:threonine dehydrogenase-like Zn-dependent dehydrogenase
MMKAFRIASPGKTEVVDLPKPAPALSEVLLRVRKVGLCGSDLATFKGANPLVSFPRIPGHEIAATVEAVGDAVPDTVEAGSDLTVVPYTNCGTCSSCQRGRFNACRNNQTLGVQRDGALAEYFVVPWRKLCATPGLSLTELALVEPLTVGFHAADRGEVTDNDTVAVFGCGMIGLGAIARAVDRGACVIVVDIDDGKLEIARRVGARHTINSRTADLHAELARLTQKHGPDVAIEAAGLSVTSRAAVDEVAFAGRVVCIGYTKEETAFATKLFVQKELDIRGSRNATPLDFQTVAGFLAKRTFPINDVLTREVTLSEVGAALTAWADRPGEVTKILVDMDPSRSG